MGDWVECSGCGLKFRSREAGCPRCQTPSTDLSPLVGLEPGQPANRAPLRDQKDDTKVLYFLACGGFLLGGVALFHHVFNHADRSWLLCPGVLLMFVALFFFTSGMARKTKCLSCGAAVDVFEADFTRCRQCKSYMQIERNSVMAVPPDYLAPKPTFAIVLPREGFRLPMECCVCGGAPTRSVRVTATSSSGGVNAAVNTLSVLSVLGGGGGLFLSGGGQTISIDLPVCHQHDEGASLKTDRTLALSSYRYYSELRRLNPKAR